MNTERLLKIIKAPVISEKSTRVAEDNKQFVFKVLKDANKREIKGAVEMLFKVEVDGVQVSNVSGKRKAFKQTMGKRSDWKKAYVKLKEGFDIDFAEAE
jgi:large subunit ribosomal protein L23